MADGVLVLAATPIGDWRDASPGLVSALGQAELIAAEDTRRLRRLAQRLGLELTAPVVSYFEGNEAARGPGLLAELVAGRRLVLVSDAGMPAVSDPGHRLVKAAIAAGVKVTAVPGPSAVLTALAVSGLPTDRFCFEGFLPRTPGARAARLRDLAAERRTMVFFEAPHRLSAFLDAATTAFGPRRPGAVCRELTKTHEQIVRAPLSDLADWANGGVLGEVTVVIGGAASDRPDQADSSDEATSLAEAVAEVRALLAAGSKPAAAVAAVAASRRYDRHQLYRAVTRSRSTTTEIPDRA
ncbi:MAG: 16S rRNA (cytidine(1402)-2'-O)-methyltransferase [Propionibacteriaceae bacterium]|jgi:16S rRNA (cytidine1402-2'-O)-methyltransferase|nr:16S rRNA (cytidine(1402)-2'-O)-methyltransferase [Propionibacteriaceae bacterium]